MTTAGSGGSGSRKHRSKDTRKTVIAVSAANAASASANPAGAQSGSEQGGERRHLDQLALLELGVRLDDGLPARGELTVGE